MRQQHSEVVADSTPAGGGELTSGSNGGGSYSGGTLYRLSRLQRLTREYMSSRIVEYGLSVPAFSAIVVVASSDPITNADLARASYVSPQTMNSIVVDLEDRGFFRRTHAEVGRGLLIELTSTGRLLYERLEEIQQELFELMVGSSAADMDQFSGMLSHFIANLEEIELRK